MGFFKNIGKAVKKINLRSVGKLATNFAGLIPVAGGVVGNIVDGQIAKGEQKSAIKAQNAMDQQSMNMQAAQQYFAQQQAKKSGGSITNMLASSVQRTDPNFNDILMGGLGGLATGVGGVLAGTTTAGQVGSTVIDNSITTWFQTNWYKVLGALAVLGGVIYFATRGGRNSRRR